MGRIKLTSMKVTICSRYGSEDEMAIIWRRDTVEKRETGDQQTTILKSSLTIRLPPH